MAQNKPFRTVLDPPLIIESNPGSDFEEIIAMRIADNGEEEFYIKGKTNIYEKIQMFKDDCELENILMRVSDTGDISLLQKADPFFVDMEDFPENIFDAHRKIKEAQEEFANLPIDIKEAYGNSFDRFLADFGSDNWLKIMGINKPEEKEEITTKGETTEE